MKRKHDQSLGPPSYTASATLEPRDTHTTPPTAFSPLAIAWRGLKSECQPVKTCPGLKLRFCEFVGPTSVLMGSRTLPWLLEQWRPAALPLLKSPNRSIWRIKSAAQVRWRHLADKAALFEAKPHRATYSSVSSQQQSTSPPLSFVL